MCVVLHSQFTDHSIALLEEREYYEVTISGL